MSGVTSDAIEARRARIVGGEIRTGRAPSR